MPVSTRSKSPIRTNNVHRRRQSSSTLSSRQRNTSSKDISNSSRPVKRTWLENAKNLIVLGRPRFLMYSLACHLLGALCARRQGVPLDWPTFVLLQFTVWSTHLFAHYVNEWADYEADKANKNVGGWTGGSQVLASGLLPRWTAIVMAAVTFSNAFVGGVAVCVRYLHVRADIAPSSLLHWDGFLHALSFVPWDFVAVGVSVLAVAAAYSLPPLRLSANALGEACVAYVLSFAAPAVGLAAQSGQITRSFQQILLPFVLLSFARMIVMNIADRDGDAAVEKRTSVVWLGEQRAIHVINAMHAAVYLIVIPSLPELSYTLRCAYYLTIPLRWWQSIRLNSPEWWRDAALVRSLPFWESLFVLSTAIAVCIGLVVEQRIGKDEIGF